MTAFAPYDDSAANLSAFNLGVFANEFLWNVDQAVVAGSGHHRIAALALIRRLQALGAEFTELKTDAPFQVVLNEIREYLPDNVTQSYGESWDDELSRGMDTSDCRSEGEWWYGHFSLDRERQRLRQVIVDETLQSPEQRLWFRLGDLIDSGRHRPDVGHQIYQGPPGFIGPPSPHHTQGSDGGSMWSPFNPDWGGVGAPASEQLPGLWTFSSGQLPPRPEWWQEVVHLCQQLDVPCNPDEPDLSSPQLVVAIVEQLIESARSMLCDRQSDASVPSALASAAMAGSGGEQQQSTTCSPIVRPEHRGDEESSPAGGEADVLNRSSCVLPTGDGASSEFDVANTPQAARDGTVPTKALVSSNRVEASGGVDSTQMNDRGSGPIDADAPQPADTTPDHGADQAAHSPQTGPPVEEPEKIGNWRFWPVQVEFKDNTRFGLTDQPRAILKCLLQTKNPDGWVGWTRLANDAWEKDAEPDSKAVITGVSRLRAKLKKGLENQCPSDPITSQGSKTDLSFRIDSSLR